VRPAGLTYALQEEFYGRELILADRDLVELEAEEILKEADTSDVAFLVVVQDQLEAVHLFRIGSGVQRGPMEGEPPRNTTS
jgi:hypothetical protein